MKKNLKVVCDICKGCGVMGDWALSGDRSLTEGRPCFACETKGWERVSFEVFEKKKNIPRSIKVVNIPYLDKRDSVRIKSVGKINWETGDFQIPHRKKGAYQ